MRAAKARSTALPRPRGGAPLVRHRPRRRRPVAGSASHGSQPEPQALRRPPLRPVLRLLRLTRPRTSVNCWTNTAWPVTTPARERPTCCSTRPTSTTSPKIPRSGRKSSGGCGPTPCLLPDGLSPIRPRRPGSCRGSSRARTSRQALHPIAGRAPIHRLNRTGASTRSATCSDIEIDGRALLPGDSSDRRGFDNIADVLSISPALMDRYLSASRKISRLAVDSLPVPTSAARDQQNLSQDDRMSEDLPFGSRGVRPFRTIPDRRRIRLHRQLSGSATTTSEASAQHEMDVQLDGAPLEALHLPGDEKWSSSRLRLDTPGISTAQGVGSLHARKPTTVLGARTTVRPAPPRRWCLVC